LRRQRDLAYELITAIPGVTCVRPVAALYTFPRLDPKIYPIEDDQAFFLELLQETRVMLVQGTGFNWPAPDHFRIVFLPHEDDLREAIGRVARFLEHARKRFGTDGLVVPAGDGLDASATKVATVTKIGRKKR
jgi:alanine-synthesizing transaminase